MNETVWMVRSERENAFFATGLGNGRHSGNVAYKWPH